MNGAGCDRFWACDPLPVPPDAPVYSTVWWRWVSACVLEARRVV